MLMTYNDNTNSLKITLLKNIDVSSKFKDNFNFFRLIKSGIEFNRCL